jgi:hypothetical protein
MSSLWSPKTIDEIKKKLGDSENFGVPVEGADSTVLTSFQILYILVSILGHMSSHAASALCARYFKSVPRRANSFSAIFPPPVLR